MTNAGLAYNIGKSGRNILRYLLLAIPASIRVSIFRLIFRTSEFWDKASHPSVKFLPLGLCLKMGRRVCENEANALELVEIHDDKCASTRQFTRDHKNNEGFLLTTKIPGIRQTSTLIE